MSEELTDGAKRFYDEGLPGLDAVVFEQTDIIDDPRAGVSDMRFERGAVIDTDFEPLQAFAAPEPDALTITFDAPIEMQDALYSTFDSEFTPLPDEAGEVQRDEPSVDDGF